MNLNSIPAFQDNYIWILNDEAGKCLIVDPGEAAPVFEAIDSHSWKPQAILLTHHHNDHTGGVTELLRRYPEITVYGPAETQSKGATVVVAEGETVTVLGHDFQVIATPGHTAGHISFFSSPYLFCGDTLFSGGCGRLFEGTPAQMYQSFQKLNALPEDTLICCAHEYTLSNMEFARHILPEDQSIEHFYQKVKELRVKSLKTLPSTLQKEREINLFLRTHDTDLINKIKKEAPLQQPEEIFAWLRAKKDNF